MKQRIERRLTAILAADVAGYSRLMGADEEGTHERLQAHLGELVNPKIKEHRGRTVKTAGDGAHPSRDRAVFAPDPRLCTAPRWSRAAAALAVV